MDTPHRKKFIWLLAGPWVSCESEIKRLTVIMPSDIQEEHVLCDLFVVDFRQYYAQIVSLSNDAHLSFL